MLSSRLRHRSARCTPSRANARRRTVGRPQHTAIQPQTTTDGDRDEDDHQHLGAIRRGGAGSPTACLRSRPLSRDRTRCPRCPASRGSQKRACRSWQPFYESCGLEASSLSAYLRADAMPADCSVDRSARARRPHISVADPRQQCWTQTLQACDRVVLSSNDPQTHDQDQRHSEGGQEGRRIGVVPCGWSLGWRHADRDQFGPRIRLR